MTNDGVLHTHEDGTTHRHFREGFTIGKQVVADEDGTENHEHSSFNMVSGERGKSSSPVAR